MSPSVRAHAHHIISVRQWPAEKNMSISHSRENTVGKKGKEIVSYFVDVLVWGSEFIQS